MAGATPEEVASFHRLQTGADHDFFIYVTLTIPLVEQKKAEASMNGQSRLAGLLGPTWAAFCWLALICR